MNIATQPILTELWTDSIKKVECFMACSTGNWQQILVTAQPACLVHCGGHDEVVKQSTFAAALAKLRAPAAGI